MGRQTVLEGGVVTLPCINRLPWVEVGRDSSVGIATRYGLDSPGIEYQWAWDLRHSSRPALGPTQPSIQRVSGLLLGVKRPGGAVDHPPPSSAEVKERIGLQLYPPTPLSLRGGLLGELYWMGMRGQAHFPAFFPAKEPKIFPGEELPFTAFRFHFTLQHWKVWGCELESTGSS